MNTPTTEFELFPEEKHFWSFNDYRCVLETTRRLQPKTVLEFGPGSSTLALIEGGAHRIDSCEDNPDWAKVYVERLAGRFPWAVNIVPYTWVDPLSIPTIDDRRYDLAMIDGPFGTERRGAVLDYCLERCASVLICVENSKGTGLRDTILRVFDRRGGMIEIMETGPLAGSFALITGLPGNDVDVVTR